MDSRMNVPLEEALNIAGCGLYSYALMVLTGMVDMTANAGIMVMSVVIPAAGCDLNLTSYQKGALTSMVFTGMIFSSHLSGFLADSYGRRTVMQFCSLGSIIMSIVSSLAPNALVLMITSFISGALLAGILTPICVYISECCPRETRAKGIFICFAVSSLAAFYLNASAWLVIPLKIYVPIFNSGIVFTSWRLFIALLAVPFTISYLWLLFLPETPKYLLSKGKHDETMEVLRALYTYNHRGREEVFPVLSVSLDTSDSMPEKSGDKSSPLIQFFNEIYCQTKMIFSPPYLKYAVISCLLNVGVIGVFNTILLWFPETVNRLVFHSTGNETYSVRLCDVMADQSRSDGADDSCGIGDNTYYINIAYSILQSTSYILVSFIIQRVNKKHFIVVLSVLTTILCASVVIGNIILIITALIGIMIFLLVIFPIYISIVVDFFPTSLRTNATSIVMLCGRIFSMLGSQALGATYASYCELAYPGLTFLLAGMTVLFIILPSSRN